MALIYATQTKGRRRVPSVAGPGGVEGLPLRGVRLIKSADGGVYDRLVSEAIMAEVPDHTLAIDVGKKPGSHGLK